MTHAICGVYPEVFAAGAPFNAYDFAYFKQPKAVYAGVVKGVDTAALSQVSVQHQMADAKWGEKTYRMPIFQTAGCNDSTIANRPVDDQTDDVRIQTIENWKKRNNIPTENPLDAQTLTGLAADENFYEDEDQRFFHQRWHSADPDAPVLLEQLTAKRMPHAIVPVQTEFAWKFIKKFRRLPDGELQIGEE